MPVNESNPRPVFASNRLTHSVCDREGWYREPSDGKAGNRATQSFTRYEWHAAVIDRSGFELDGDGS
jgi:hypothetical protein